MANRFGFLAVLAATAPILSAAGHADISRPFAGLNACYVLYDLQADKEVPRYGGPRCQEQTVA